MLIDKFNKTHITCLCLAILASNNASATGLSDTQNKKEIKEDAIQVDGDRLKTNISGADSTTIIGARKIKESLGALTESDSELNKESILQAKDKRVVAEINLNDNLIKLKKKSFIANNVPSEIIALGDEAVRAYISEHFIDSKDSKVNHLPEKEVVWVTKSEDFYVPPNKKTDDVLVKKVETTTLTKTSVDVPKEDLHTGKSAVSSDAITKNDIIELKKLGVSDSDIAKMLGLSITTKSSENPSESNTARNNNKEKVNDTIVDNNSETVVINNISVNRSILTPAYSEVDVELTLSIANEERTKTKTMEVKNLKKGDIFDIAGTRFEVLDINNKLISIRNTKSNKISQKII
jgi:hypothetical protein